MDWRMNGPAKKRTDRSSNFKNYLSDLVRSGTTRRSGHAKECGQHGHVSPPPCMPYIRRAAAIKGLHRHHCRRSRNLRQLLPSFDLRSHRGPNGERMSGLCASGRRRLVLAVGSCPAQPPTGPNHAAAGLLIRPTVTAGIRTHGVLRSARQQHGLLRLYAAYIVCQKRRALTVAGPKKDPRPVLSSLGPARSRTGNWNGSDSIMYSRHLG